MDPFELVEGRPYVTVDNVDVCNYSEGVCSVQNMITLPEGTILTYIGPSEAHDGFIFKNDEKAEFCLHDNDLLYINFATE